MNRAWTQGGFQCVKITSEDNSGQPSKVDLLYYGVTKFSAEPAR